MSAQSETNPVHSERTHGICVFPTAVALLSLQAEPTSREILNRTPEGAGGIGRQEGTPHHSSSGGNTSQFEAFHVVAGVTQRTPLSIAAETEAGEAPVVQAMIGAGYDVNKTDEAPEGRTPLHAACFTNRVRTIGMLVAAGANVDGKCTHIEATPLHFSAACQNLKSVEALLGHGAHVNALDMMGRTPLHRATETITKNTVKIVQCLLAAGGNQTIVSEFEETAMGNVDKCTCLRRSEVVEELKALLSHQA